MLPKRQILYTLILGLTINLSSTAQIQELKNWLSAPMMDRMPLETLNFSNGALTKNETESASTLLLDDKKKIYYTVLVNNGMIAYCYMTI